MSEREAELEQKGHEKRAKGMRKTDSEGAQTVIGNEEGEQEKGSSWK